MGVVPWLPLSIPKNTADKNAAYPKALSEMKATVTAPESCELRQVK